MWLQKTIECKKREPDAYSVTDVTSGRYKKNNRMTNRNMYVCVRYAPVVRNKKNQSKVAHTIALFKFCSSACSKSIFHSMRTCYIGLYFQTSGTKWVQQKPTICIRTLKKKNIFFVLQNARYSMTKKNRHHLRRYCRLHWPLARQSNQGVFLKKKKTIIPRVAIANLTCIGSHTQAAWAQFFGQKFCSAITCN